VGSHKKKFDSFIAQLANLQSVRISRCLFDRTLDIDYIQIHALSDASEKAYTCLFTCASTRAVHIDLIESLDVPAFIPCFQRFCAQRGMPSTLMSDNTKMFQTVAKEVKNLRGLTSQTSAFFQEKFSFKYLIDLLSIIIRDFNNKILILLSNSQVVKKSKSMRRGVCFSAKNFG